MTCNCCTIDSYICNICDYECDYFLNKKNVVGVGLGYKIKCGFETSQKCIMVFVSQKVPSNSLNSNDIIPDVYKGIVTDVLESGCFKTQSLTKKVRPTMGGYSIGSTTVGEASTLGCLVTDGKYKYILTSNHGIVKDEFAIGTKVLQPAIPDGGKVPQDVVGTISKFIPVKNTTFFHEPKNVVDCAAVIVLQESLVSPLIYGINTPPLGVANGELKSTVHKVGRTTEKTLGKVLSINAVMELEDQGKKNIYKKQIVTTEMCSDGDSGSILLNQGNYAIGLVVGGSDTYTICNTMSNVLTALNLKLVTR
ncbi:hypothetical protein ADU80_06185 [Clostridium botulinum]|uniref:Nal1 N-terminal domain-containing protein n=1 Tax=Clostridium botulinum TaxID=1491 RepID=A0A9Q1ZF06_CLOBO|nr:hypothetical protein [Clostridium botulinum]AEB75985.1 conserved hypothetical protein [Clostridium botulinum BKT015925]KEI01350.1 hypothetical protein Y848_09470 [Clostridium botulinum C/D str. Sp77]KOA73092.1 hypothetical protein ADU77_14015 [Clostridium botulinum]KOA82069.1 hypothetical protein ADU75_13215 [Clostridium botulinum]KOA85889.1 hypothetical protein ADU80_06185 [Clostridium botulinum]